MIRALIVDDERMARQELRRLLRAHPEVEVVGEAASASEADELVTRLQPDLVFLDIQMPGLSGIEFAADLEGRTRVIFCTAFDSFAIDAFALNALDYLVKPIAPERLARSLQRVEPMHNDVVDVLPLDHGLLLKFGESARIVRLSEIDRFESVGNHAAVYTRHGKSYVLSSLTRIEQRLDPRHFFRANRGDILRVDAILSLDPGIGSAWVAVLTDGSEVEISRRQAQLLKDRMGL